MHSVTRPATALAALLLCLVAGCGTPSISSGAIAGATPPASASADTAAPSAVPGSGGPDGSPPASAAADGDGLPRPVVVTIVDRVRVRSEPRIADDSILYEPVLPTGTALFVLDGPTVASGYEWYQVVPLSFEVGGGYGWVAAASREGEAWISPAEASCPPQPASVAELVGLSPGLALACFAGVPISLEVRVVPCNCDYDGPQTEPAWLGVDGAEPVLLVDPALTAAPSNVEEWLILHLHPSVGDAGSIPSGSIANVTGTFDHPAAAGCQETGLDEPLHPEPTCRFAFAVTALELH
jgi:hypothetical protein